ncbi:MAG: iron ABC transporter permease [Deltaproteobacteria bacterium]|nr:iron ABC transporter permease [Deltaproteobacteria bacterium]
MIRLALAATLTAPLLWLAIVGFDARAFGLMDYAALWIGTRNTLIYALSVAAITGVLAPIFAFVLTRARFAGRGALQALLTFPAALPAVLLAMGQLDAWSDKGGLFAGALPFAITGPVGIVLVTAGAYLPWLLEPLCRAIERCDVALEEAARVSGAGPLRAFVQATWPLIRGEWLAGVTVIASMTAATFGVPYFLGSLAEKPFATLTTDMVQIVSLSGEAATARATLLAVPLVLFSLGTFFLAARLRGKTSGDSGRPGIAVRMPLTPATRAAVVIAWIFGVLSVLVPLVALVARATAADPSRPLSSARSLAAFTALAATAAPFLRSIALATISAAAIVLVAATWALAREGRAAVAARQSLTVLYALPGTLVALGLVFFAASNVRVVLFDRVTLAFALSNTLVLIAIAYVTKYLAVGIETARAAFARVSPTLVEAARLSGASPRTAALHVTLALSRPALVSVYALLWMTLLPELTMSVLLFGPETQTLGTTLFELATYTDPAQAAALAVLLSAMCMGLHTWVGRRAMVDHG